MATKSLSSATELRRSSAAGLLTGILLLAVVVLSRRMVGALTGFSSASAACLLSGFVMLVGLASGLSLKRDRDTGAHSLLLATLSALPGLAMGLALLPSQDASGLAALLGEFGILVIAGLNLSPVVVARSQPDNEESVPFQESSQINARGLFDSESIGVARHTEVDAGGVNAESMAPVATRPVEVEVAASDALAHSTNSLHVDVADITEASDGRFDDHHLNWTQWMQRRLCDGCDVIEGRVRVTLPSGVKHVAVHVPFAPAFVTSPQFEAEPLSEADVEVRQTSLHCYGVRFEVTRRQRIHETASVEISYFASAAMCESAAA